ncbi:uncharacterized protein [Clytia hemisphaerica]|uniref:uncharacterized protein n=1 Tax=Clytia hemisphaerica TaxID=252671 RepID=UPI0034D4377D
MDDFPKYYEKIFTTFDTFNADEMLGFEPESSGEEKLFSAKVDGNSSAGNIATDSPPSQKETQEEKVSSVIKIDDNVSGDNVKTISSEEKQERVPEEPKVLICTDELINRLSYLPDWNISNLLDASSKSPMDGQTSLQQHHEAIGPALDGVEKMLEQINSNLSLQIHNFFGDSNDSIDLHPEEKSAPQVESSLPAPEKQEVVSNPAQIPCNGLNESSLPIEEEDIPSTCGKVNPNTNTQTTLEAGFHNSTSAHQDGSPFESQKPVDLSDINQQIGIDLTYLELLSQTCDPNTLETGFLNSTLLQQNCIPTEPQNPAQLSDINQPITIDLTHLDETPLPPVNLNNTGLTTSANDLIAALNSGDLGNFSTIANDQLAALLSRDLSQPPRVDENQHAAPSKSKRRRRRNRVEPTQTTGESSALANNTLIDQDPLPGSKKKRGRRRNVQQSPCNDEQFSMSGLSTQIQLPGPSAVNDQQSFGQIQTSMMDYLQQQPEASTSSFGQGNSLESNSLTQEEMFKLIQAQLMDFEAPQTNNQPASYQNISNATQQQIPCMLSGMSQIPHQVPANQSPFLTNGQFIQNPNLMYQTQPELQQTHFNQNAQMAAPQLMSTNQYPTPSNNNPYFNAPMAEPHIQYGLQQHCNGFGHQIQAQNLPQIGTDQFSNHRQNYQPIFNSTQRSPVQHESHQTFYNARNAPMEGSRSVNPNQPPFASNSLENLTPAHLTDLQQTAFNQTIPNGSIPQMNLNQPFNQQTADYQYLNQPTFSALHHQTSYQQPHSGQIGSPIHTHCAAPSIESYIQPQQQHHQQKFIEQPQRELKIVLPGTFIEPPSLAGELDSGVPLYEFNATQIRGSGYAIFNQSHGQQQPIRQRRGKRAHDDVEFPSVAKMPRRQ